MDEEKKEEKEKRKNIQYSAENLRLAINGVKNGEKCARMSRIYKIPESTLRAKLKLFCDPNKKPGRQTVLSNEEEKELVDWIIECGRYGCPVTKDELLDSVEHICIADKRKNNFINNRPGEKFYKRFLRDHPEISRRVPEKINLNRAKVTEQSLKKWHDEVLQTLIAENLVNIDSSRIFNSDETGLPLNPLPPTVLAAKGSRQVYSVVNNNEKENVTVLVTADAAGNLAPTLVLFKGQSLPENLNTVNVPPDFYFAYSEGGYMTSQNFYEYMANAFEPWLTENNIQRPVIFYLDGHGSHLSLHVSKFCSQHEIFLVKLHPNATHIIQPLDVALFKALKALWWKIIDEFCKGAFCTGLTKVQIAPILFRTFKKMNLKEILTNGFRKCGLYPFDFNAIDLTKIVSQNDTIQSVEKVSDLEMVEESSTREILQNFIHQNLEKSTEIDTIACLLTEKQIE